MGATNLTHVLNFAEIFGNLTFGRLTRTGASVNCGRRIDSSTVRWGSRILSNEIAVCRVRLRDGNHYTFGCSRFTVNDDSYVFRHVGVVVADLTVPKSHVLSVECECR